MLFFKLVATRQKWRVFSFYMLKFSVVCRYCYNNYCSNNNNIYICRMKKQSQINIGLTIGGLFIFRTLLTLIFNI